MLKRFVDFKGDNSCVIKNVSELGAIDYDRNSIFF